MTSKRAIAGLVILTVALLVLGLRVLFLADGSVDIDLPVVGLPVALLASLLLASAPESRGQRSLAATAVGTGVALWIASLLFLSQYGWGPSPGGWQGALLGFMDTAFYLAFSAILAGIWTCLGPVSRARTPRFHPWLLIPAPVVWALIVGLEFADDLLGVVAHDAPVWLVLYVALSTAAVAATGGLLATSQLPGDPEEDDLGPA